MFSYVTFHLETVTTNSCKCHVCGNSFKMKCYITKHLQKKHLICFGSKFNISDIFYKMQNIKKRQMKAVFPFLPRNLKLHSPYVQGFDTQLYQTQSAHPFVQNHCTAITLHITNYILHITHTSHFTSQITQYTLHIHHTTHHKLHITHTSHYTSHYNSAMTLHLTHHPSNTTQYVFKNQKVRVPQED